MVPNRKRVLAAAAAAGIAFCALVDGSAAVASAVSPARSSVTAAAAAPASTQPPGLCGAMGKIWSAHDPAFKAAASYLGLSQAQLRSELQSGKSLADVARAHGKSVEGLKSTMLAAITSWVNASSSLSAPQKAKVIAEVKDHLGTLVNMSCRSGMGHHMGY
jgi:hypothetical protein